MDKDIFISTEKNFVEHQQFQNDDNNFFIQPENISVRKPMQAEQSRHLNDYDANILQKGAYREVRDEVFKLEYKIAEIEEELKNLDKQIQSANDIHDYFLADDLYSRKKQLEENLKTLTEIYKETSLSAKISGGFSSKIRAFFVPLQNFVKYIFELFLSKAPCKISSVFAVRNSLSKLENINKSVDTLISYQYPYGEAGEKYERLSRYIAKANSIQSEIYKFMK